MFTVLLEKFLLFTESSGFYFVPIALMFSIFGLKSLKNRRQVQSFLLLVFPLLALYLFFGKSSSRYLFIPLLLAGCLAGNGIENMVRLLRKTKIPFLRKIPMMYIVLLFVFAAVLCSFLKLSLRTRDTHIREMAQFLRPIALQQPLTLYGIEFAQSRKLGGELIALPDVEYFQFIQWSEVMPTLAVHQTEKRNIYAAVRVPAAYPTESILTGLRGKFYIAPFEIVYSVKAGKYCYVLLKFNYRTLDGRQKGFRRPLLAALPDTLSTTAYKQWEIFDPAEYLSTDNVDGFIPNGYGTNIAGKVYFRRIDGQLPDPPALELRNELGFLEGVRDFKIRNQAPLPPEPLPEPQLIAGGLPADAPPLVLPAGEIRVPEHWQYLHLSHLVPLWRSDAANRITFSCGNEKILIAPPVKGKIEVADTVLKQSTVLELDIRTADLSSLQERKLNLLVINDAFAARLNLAAHLRALMGKSTVAELELPQRGECAVTNGEITVLPAGKFDAVLLNVFADAFARPWTVPLQIDPFLDEHLSKLTEKVQRQYPGTELLLILPPPHAPNDTMYSMNNSSLLSRIAHYHIISGVYRWHQRNKSDRIRLIPTYLGIDPTEDYIWHWRQKNIRSGFAFTPAGEKKIAEAAAAHLNF